MSSPPRRRRRSRAGKHGTATVALVAAVAVLASYRDRLVLAVVLSALATALVLGGLYLARHVPAAAVERRRARPKRPAARPAPQPKAPRRPVPPPPDPWADLPAGTRKTRQARQASARAQAFGPAKPRMVTLAVSQECADGQCHACPDPDTCEHCDHNLAAFMDRNRQAYDLANANGHDVPPF